MPSIQPVMPGILDALVLRNCSSTTLVCLLACMKFVDFSVARSTLVTNLWTNFRIGVIADAFNETGIQNHPAMSAAQVRFIIQQAKSAKKSGSAGDINNLKAQVKYLQELVRKQEAQLEQHGGRLVQIESCADCACAALELCLDSKKQRGKKKKARKNGRVPPPSQ